MAYARSFDLGSNEIIRAHLSSLGWRNMGLELELHNGDHTALKVTSLGALRIALDAIDVVHETD